MQDIDFDKYDDYDSDIGESEYSPKSDFSKGKLIYEAFVDCQKCRAVEMRSGYYNTTISADGLPIKSWIADSRKKYWSSVQALRRLLAPEILDAIKSEKEEYEKKQKDVKDKEKFVSSIEGIITDMNNLFNKYAYTEYEMDTSRGVIEYKKSEKKFLPEIDSIIKTIKVYPDGSKKMDQARGLWNVYVNAYWDEMVILSDRLLEELMKIIHNSNYFKSKTRFG